MRKRGFMTVGYGNMNVKEFIENIKKLRVNCIVDVRTRPYSKYNLLFNKEELRDRLSDEGISYFWLGNKLGGRYDKIKYCDEQGRVDYEKVAASEKFIDGIKELEKLITKYNVCVMCSEMEPLRCHRFLLISRALKEYNIHHIMPDGTLVKNVELEKKLLNMYGDINQLSIFDTDNIESLETIAYRKHVSKTAYVSEKVKELLSQGITEDIPEKIKVYCIGCEGKTAEEFFELLKENKVRKIIDVREYNQISSATFARYPDIAYYLKLHCISYERLQDLIPKGQILTFKSNGSSTKYFSKYCEHINQNNTLLSLLSDELDGVCFLGYDEDYKKCHRNIIIKELKRRNKNITVRHLK